MALQDFAQGKDCMVMSKRARTRKPNEEKERNEGK